MDNNIKTILVTGGAGYVGSVLTPALLKLGYHVKVLDLFIYGEDTLDEVSNHKDLEIIKGDIRDQTLLAKSLKGCDAVIHLACISNDPSVELDPDLSTSINYTAFEPLVEMSREMGVKRFIFASSGSVYGVSEESDVTEEHPLVPISYYNKYKALCESVLKEYQSADFTTVTIRPATICGYSPRQRLDLTVNILTNHAVNAGVIKIFGGKQMRPNIHIQDMVDLYVKLLECPKEIIEGEIFNAGFENYTVAQIGEIVKDIVQNNLSEQKTIKIENVPSDDIRSYHLSSEKIKRELGFTPSFGIKKGVHDLIKAFNAGIIPDSMNDIRYYNVKLMKQVGLT